MLVNTCNFLNLSFLMSVPGIFLVIVISIRLLGAVVSVLSQSSALTVLLCNIEYRLFYFIFLMASQKRKKKERKKEKVRLCPTNIMY